MNYKLYVSLNSIDQYIKDFSKEVSFVVPFHIYDKFNSLQGEPFYVSLPHVVRNKDIDNLKQFIGNISSNYRVEGVFVNNIESLQLLMDMGFEKRIILGPGLYIWNKEAEKCFLNNAHEFIYPYELSKHEIKEISSENGILTVYGKTPLMICANCIRNTLDKCCKDKGSQVGYLRDRKNMELPVLFQCKSCYNIIYNAVATSLHEYVGKDLQFITNYMISFSDEDSELSKSLLDFYINLLKGSKKEFPIKDFTKAYYNRGVE